MTSGSGVGELFAGASSANETQTILFRDQALLHQIMNGGFECHHAMRAPGLHCRSDLMCFAFANKVRHGGNIDQNLNDRHSALMIGARE